jgi:hypothetical protein
MLKTQEDETQQNEEEKRSASSDFSDIEFPDEEPKPSFPLATNSSPAIQVASKLIQVDVKVSGHEKFFNKHILHISLQHLQLKVTSP